MKKLLLAAFTMGLATLWVIADPTNNATSKPANESASSTEGGKTNSPAALIGYGLTALIGFFAWMENREKRKAQDAKAHAEARATSAETQARMNELQATSLAAEVQTTQQKAAKLAEENSQLSVRAKDLEGKLLYVRKGITEPVQLPGGSFRNLMMIIGLGGSGKTSVIKMIFNDQGANPEVRTEEQKLYRTHFGFNVGNPNGEPARTLHVFACDYVGQNLSTLTRTFVKQQQDLYSPMAYGFINALILVVDLREPPAEDGGTIPVTDGPNLNRIEEHKTEWNETALAALAGFVVADTLKFVCLYINKIDALNHSSSADRLKYKALYEPLRSRLAERFSPARVTVIVGAAANGDGYNELRQGLVDSAMRVPLENNAERPAEMRP